MCQYIMLEVLIKRSKLILIRNIINNIYNVKIKKN